MTRNHSIKRFLSGTIGAVMFLSALPAIAANAAVGTTVLTYDDYEVSYAVTDEWNGGQNVLITVTNLGDESLYNWAFKYDAGGSIDGIYNAVVFENEDTDYIVKNNGWNFELAPQRSVSFGYTMRGEEFSVPTDFELRSERVDVAEGYEVEVTYDDVWQDGARGQITVTNTTEQPLEAWKLGFDTNFQLEYVWNGRIVDNDENHYVAASEAWTQYLAPGQSKSIGFVGSFEPGTEPEFSNYELSQVRIKGLHETGDPINEIDMDTDNIDLGYIENLINAGLITVNFDHNSRLRALDGKFTNKKLETAEDAAHILNCAHTLFSDTFHADAEDIVISTDGDETFFKYIMKVNGVPVLGSQIILSARDGVSTGMSSSYNKLAETANTAPSITSDAAVDAVLADIFAEYPSRFNAVVRKSGLTEAEVTEIFKNSFEVTPELVIFPMNSKTLTLTWKIKIVNNNVKTADTVIDYNDVNDYSKYLFSFINREYNLYADGVNAGTIYSHTGSGNSLWNNTTGNGIDLANNVRNFGAQSGTGSDSGYRMRDDVRNIETYKTDLEVIELSDDPADSFVTPYIPGTMFTSGNGTFTDAHGVSAHANMSDIYDYYKNVLGRDSYDGHHAKIVISTGYREEVDPYINAFWSPSDQQFVFGDAGSSIQFENAVDVMAHEFQHAVTGDIANLTYWGESGALNEAYSDIFGTLVEGKAYTDPGFANMGEDCGLIVRNLADPESIIEDDGHTYSADHYSDLNDPWFRSIAPYDRGGVHIFSTIFGRAAYLMMTDEANASITPEQWAEVFYKSLRYVTSDAEFLDGRYAVVRAAKELGFTSLQQEAIKNAFDTVGICEPYSLRIVLRWGKTTVPDLDSHLVGPRVTGNGNFHTYYIDKSYYVDDTYNSVLNADFAAELDYDDTDYEGPEITTIHNFSVGDYYFYVHDYTNRASTTSTEMSTSEVTVSVFQGSSDIPVYQADGTPAVFTIDEMQVGTLWKVFKISVASNGHAVITPEGAITLHSVPSTVGA